MSKQFSRHCIVSSGSTWEYFGGKVRSKAEQEIELTMILVQPEKEGSIWKYALVEHLHNHRVAGAIL